MFEKYSFKSARGIFKNKENEKHWKERRIFLRQLAPLKILAYFSFTIVKPRGFAPTIKCEIE